MKTFGKLLEQEKDICPVIKVTITMMFSSKFLYIILDAIEIAVILIIIEQGTIYIVAIVTCIAMNHYVNVTFLKLH
jgi:hypothetical protein